MAFPVSRERFGQLVEQALVSIPPAFERYLEEVSIEVRDRPTRREVTEMGLEHGGVLLGLYKGRPRTLRSVEESGTLPDVIYIYQESIQAVCSSEKELIEQVRKTVLHEIGHHFGMDEEDLEKLGYG
jgi:predicted Zn-dependent protease with MMP-like domain